MVTISLTVIRQSYDNNKTNGFLPPKADNRATLSGTADAVWQQFHPGSPGLIPVKRSIILLSGCLMTWLFIPSIEHMATLLREIPRPARLGDAVVRNVEQLIETGVYRPGDRMPTEKELAERFGVSRAVIREAVACLKADGYVTTRQGAGAYVAPRPGLMSFRMEPADQASLPDLRHIFELRIAVETAAAELAALRHAPDDLAQISDALAQMDVALREETDGSGGDDAFHRAIARATHNPYLQRFIAFLGHHFADSRRPTWSGAGHSSGRAEAAQAEHRRLFEAIARGDSAAARDAAQEHLLHAASRLGVTDMELRS